MTREDVIRLAAEAKYYKYDATGTRVLASVNDDPWAMLERFAEYVALLERSECAKICDEIAEDEVEEDSRDAVRYCAACIRDREDDGES